MTTSESNPVIEGEGGGIREVFHAAHVQGLPRPPLINTGVQFKALLWRLESGSSVSVPDCGMVGEALFQQLLSQLPSKEGKLPYALGSALESGR